jgi:hypothetical protein
MAAVILVPALAASAGAQSRCAQLQFAAAGEAARRKAVCAARAAAFGAPVDAACLALADARLARRWARAVARGDCPTPADAAAAQAVVDGFLVALTEVLTPPPSHCCDTGARCFAGPSLDAASCTLELFGTLGAPGSVCDGATGDCVAPPGTGGNCCALPGAVCTAGPEDDPADCLAVGGQSSTAAACEPTGTCTVP